MHPFNLWVWTPLRSLLSALVSQAVTPTSIVFKLLFASKLPEPGTGGLRLAQFGQMAVHGHERSQDPLQQRVFEHAAGSDTRPHSASSERTRQTIWPDPFGTRRRSPEQLREGVGVPYLVPGVLEDQSINLGEVPLFHERSDAPRTRPADRAQA